MTPEDFYNLNENVNQVLNTGQTVRVYNGNPPCEESSGNSEPLYMEMSVFKNAPNLSLFLSILYAQGMTSASQAVRLRSDLLSAQIMGFDGSISDDKIYQFAVKMGYSALFTSYPSHEDTDEFIKVNGYKLNDETIHYVLSSPYENDETILFNPSKLITKQPSIKQKPSITYYFII